MRVRQIFRRKAVVLVILIVVSLVIISQRLVYNRLRDSLTKKILFALGSRNTSAQVLPDVNTTIINSGNCQPFPNRNMLMAVIVIISSPGEVDARNNVREKWRRWKGNFEALRLIFFVGLPDTNDFSSIEVESALHDDIVLDALIDTYYSLTLKSLRMLKWFRANCFNVKYLIKTDVDVLIHLPNLLAYLQSVEDEGHEIADKFIGGDLGIDAYPIYFPTDKWFMPPELLESVNINYGSPYPEYVLGGFYVISAPLIPAIFNESLKVPLIHFEDIFLTGIVANKRLGIKLTEIPYVASRDKSHCLDRTYMNHKYTIVACHFQNDLNLMNEYYEFYQTKFAESLKTKRRHHKT